MSLNATPPPPAILFVNVDAAAAPDTATAVMQPVSTDGVGDVSLLVLPADYCCFEVFLDKTRFFGASGFSYNLIMSAEGAVEVLQANARDNVSLEHFTSRASQGFTVARGNAMRLGYQLGGLPWSMNYSFADAHRLLGPGTLGDHLLLMAATAVLRGNMPGSALESVFANADQLGGALVVALATTVARALSKRECQDAILQHVLDRNMVELPARSGAHFLPILSQYEPIHLVAKVAGLATALTAPASTAAPTTFVVPDVHVMLSLI